jgi:hypothetical protein
MVAKTISQTVTGIKDIPQPSPGITSNITASYTRPSDWLTMPTVTTSDQIFVGLAAIFPNQENAYRLTVVVSAGNYQVDWGDGNISTYASNTEATKTYDYATYDTGNTTLTTRGYKQAIIKITPLTGNLQSVSLSSGKNYHFLDIIASGTTSFTTIGNLSLCQMCEQFRLVQGAVTSTFSNMRGLISVPELNLVGNISLNGRFNNCFSLVVVPSSFPNLTGNIDCANMFSGCYNLPSVPDYTFPISTTSGMFFDCRLLTVAPNLNLSVCTNTSSMFRSCIKLKYVPNYNTGTSLTNTSQMFDGCRNLTRAPFFNTINVTNFSSMFVNCSSLESVPLYNTANGTNFSAMFQQCNILPEIPFFNTIKATAMGAMFQYCYNLVTIPQLNTSNVTSATAMFGQCYSLETVPLLDFSKVTDFTSLHFQNFSLKSVPNYNTSNVTNFLQAFYECRSLTEFPLLDTSKVTQMATAWQGCQNLKTMPLLNTGNVSNLYLAWYLCSGMESLPVINTSNVTNFQGTFANMENLKALPAINTSKGTNFLSFAIGCTSLNRFGSTFNTANANQSGSQFFENCNSLPVIPAFNLANMTSQVSFSGSNSLSRIEATGMRVSTNVTNCSLNNTNLENLFLNLGTAATTQTVTITGNYGANAPYAAINIANCNSTQGTPTITLTTGNTSTLATGMVLTTIAGGGWLTQSVTITNGVANIAATQNGMQVDQIVSFSATVGSTILANTYYQVRSISGDGNGFEIKAYNSGAGGAAIVPTASATTTINRIPTIQSLTSNTITMNMNASGTTSTQTITFRRLNTRLASLKNWTVTG